MIPREDELPRCGLVLLTGGRGERLGGTKHDRPHPLGGSWGGHLVSVFRSIVPGGPVQLIGAPLPDVKLLSLEDPHQGPAVALRVWAASAPAPARRWWVLACDQPRWTADAFEGWLKEVEAKDPMGEAWVFVQREGHAQPLGGMVGQGLIPRIGASEARNLQSLMKNLPHFEAQGFRWMGRDIDTLRDLASWDGGR